MAPISITKVYIEQNKGFFKEIDNPHIQSSLEIPARFEENDDIVLTINGMTIDVDIINNKQRAIRDLPNRRIQQLKQKEKKILETKHVVIPLIINDEANAAQMRLIKNYVSTFKRNVETGAETILNLVGERIENLSDTEQTEVTKREYKNSIRIKREPRNLYLLYGSYSIVQARTGADITRKIQYEKISYMTIFERGQLKTEIDVYQLENGNIWHGAIVRTDKGLIFTAETNARALEQRKTLNTKLVDSRIIAKIDKKKQNFKNLNESLLNSRIREVNKKRSEFYFSNIFINQKNRNVSCSFFFNNKKYILENCLFSRMYEKIPEGLANLVALNSRIVDLKIYRRRVKKSGKSKNKLSHTSESYELFEREKEELVFQAKQEGANAQITNTQFLQEFYCLDFDLNQESRFFKFQDLFFSDKTEGLYQYKVEIQIDDVSIEIIKNDINILQSILKQLKSYSEMQVTLKKNRFAANVFSLQHTRADNLLNNYFNILNRYFINEDLNNENEVFKLKQALKAQIVAASEEPTGILNFIKLVNKLISDLTNFISLELISFDEPHIDLELNAIQKNSKRTMIINNYFSNNVVDASIAKIKNVNFFSSSGQIGYDEFDFQQFSNFLIQMNNAGRIRQDRILPYSVNLGQYGSSLNGQNRQYDEETQRTKNKRQNLLNNNLNVSVVQYQNNNNEESESEEKYAYRSDINSFFDYISSNIIENKTIDETSEIFLDLNNSLLTQFEGQIEILSSTSEKKGLWTNLRNIKNLPDEYGNYLFCRIKPRRGDPNNKIWESLKDITCTDAYFFVRISSRQEAARLLQVINSVMSGVNLSSTFSIADAKADAKIKAIDLSSRKVENFFFR